LHLAYNSVRKRIAEALLQLMEVEKSNNQTSIKINREDLASMTGTAKETVTRTLSEFREDRLIDIEGGRIQLLNSKALEDLPY
ncbi:MAG: helix-turn-helix domain-containing protein, partial [Bacteroidota bacterium]